MSDTEDARDRRMPDDGFVYQLRKIGPEASCPKVPDIMRLNLGLTRIGRGQQNDYFLDSSVLKNFISRSHVEITGSKNENGEIEFSMMDKGLNGTFVNDVRTQKTCILEIGDKITFGHTNGYKIEPGSYAEQPKSEFQFIFERIPVNSKTTEVCESVNHPDSTTETPVIDNKKESAIDRSFLSDLKSNNHVQKSAKSKTTQKVRNRKDSNSDSDSADSEKDRKVESKQKGSKKTGKSETVSRGSSKKESKDEPTSRRKSSTGSVNKFSETLPAVKDDSEASDDDDEDENDDDKNDDDDDKNNDNESKDSESASEDESEDEILPKKKRKPPPRKTAPQSTQRKTAQKARKNLQQDSSSESEDSSDNESMKPEADQKPKQSKSASKQKASPAPVSVGRKKRSSGNIAPPPPPSKQKKRKLSSGKTSATVTSERVDDLEPGVEWYDEDKCDSAGCKRPKKKRTPWVQCDDCDGWYHTVCVGANYNQLKDSDARFNCGCIS